MKTLVGCLLLACVACGGDTKSQDNTGAEELTKVGDKVTLHELDKDKYVELCNELNESANLDSDYVERTCTFIAAQNAQLEDEERDCATMRKDCIAHPPRLCNVDGPSERGNLECQGITSNAYFGCLKASRQAAGERYRDVTCDTSLDEVERIWDEKGNFYAIPRDDSPDCKLLFEQCPSLFVNL
jgi:hypothetical protein